WAWPGGNHTNPGTNLIIFKGTGHVPAYFVNIQGRESEAHPAISIIASLDCERYHLPPIQGYKCYIPSIGASMNAAYP
ncbi:MAG: hypothetical protein ACLPT6_15190, partial [Desulfobaccales bacterium]